MSLYSKIINEVAKVVKKEINEAFDFNNINTSNNRNKQIIDTVRAAVQQHVKISNILHKFNIPLMRGGKDSVDSNGMPVYWYGSKKKVNNRFETNNAIQNYVRILRNGYKWEWFGKTTEPNIYHEIVQRFNLFDGQTGDIKPSISIILISPDNGLLFIQYDTNNFYFNNEIYSFGFKIIQTGLVTYYIDDSVKKPKKVERNIDGLPITKYDEDTAYNMYVELMQLSKDISDYDSPYWEAYTKKYDEFEKKYHPRKLKYDDPKYKEYEKELDEWENNARHEFKLDSKEYNALKKRYNELRARMKESLTAVEYNNTHKKNMNLSYIFFKKYCPHKEFHYYQLK